MQFYPASLYARHYQVCHLTLWVRNRVPMSLCCRTIGVGLPSSFICMNGLLQYLEGELISHTKSQPQPITINVHLSGPQIKGSLQISYLHNKLIMLQAYLVLFLSLLVYPSTSAWSQLINGSLNMPGHVYSVYCNAGSRITGAARWNGTADLDIYLYGENKRLMYYRDSSQSYLSFLANTEPFTYNVPSTGRYYLRVYPYRIGTTLAYTLQAYVNNNPAPILYEGYYHSESKLMNAVPAGNVPQNRSIGVKYTISGTSDISVVVVSSNSAVKYTPNPGEALCLPEVFSNGEWTLIFTHSITNMVTLTPYFFRFFTSPDPADCNASTSSSSDCWSGFVWSQTAATCLPQSSNEDQVIDNTIYNSSSSANSITRIIITVITSTIAFFILVAIIVCVVKNRRRVAASIKPLQVEEEQVSQQNLDNGEKDVCSICLEMGCTAYLPCHHWFHFECISEWYARNKHCPMCRKEFKGLKVIRRAQRP